MIIFRCLNSVAYGTLTVEDTERHCEKSLGDPLSTEQNISRTPYLIVRRLIVTVLLGLSVMVVSPLNVSGVQPLKIKPVSASLGNITKQYSALLPPYLLAISCPTTSDCVAVGDDVKTGYTAALSGMVNPM